MRRVTIKLVLALLATLLPIVAASAAPASADPLADRFLAKINALRASKGLGQLHTDGALTAFAQSWTDHMAAANSLSHHPALASAPGNWTKAGENVGVGGDLDALFDAFVASPHHYENLVDPAFNTIGIGVTVTASGTMYTTHDFEALPSSAPARAATTAAAAAPAATPPPTTPPTTSPKAPAPEPPAPEAAAPPAPAPAPPPPPPPAEAPMRLRVSLDQSRGLEPV